MPKKVDPAALAGADRAGDRLARRLVDTTIASGAPAAHGVLRLSIASRALDRLAAGSGDPNLLNVGTAELARRARGSSRGSGMSAADIARALGLHRAGRQFSGRCPSCDYASGFSVTERDGMLHRRLAGGCS